MPRLAAGDTPPYDGTHSAAHHLRSTVRGWLTEALAPIGLELAEAQRPIRLAIVESEVE